MKRSFAIYNCKPGQTLINGVCVDDITPDPPFAGCPQGFHLDENGVCVPDEGDEG